MIKLLNYIHEEDKTILNFSKNQSVVFYSFGRDIISKVSDGITKNAVKEIKTELEKNGLKANLDRFINQEFKEYKDGYR